MVVVRDTSFNPTLVRLRPYAGWLKRSFSRRFNPTPVRLRPEVDHVPEGDGGGFNPTLVRLRRRDKTLRAKLLAGFNPTLVRLRQVRSTARGGQYVRFQSHAGSIEAEYDPNLGMWCDSNVSIPRWFD